MTDRLPGAAAQHFLLLLLTTPLLQIIAARCKESSLDFSPTPPHPPISFTCHILLSSATANGTSDIHLHPFSISLHKILFLIRISASLRRSARGHTAPNQKLSGTKLALALLPTPQVTSHKLQVTMEQEHYFTNNVVIGLTDHYLFAVHAFAMGYIQSLPINKLHFAFQFHHFICDRVHANFKPRTRDCSTVWKQELIGCDPAPTHNTQVTPLTYNTFQTIVFALTY